LWQNPFRSGFSGSRDFLCRWGFSRIFRGSFNRCVRRDSRGFSRCRFCRDIGGRFHRGLWFLRQGDFRCNVAGCRYFDRCFFREFGRGRRFERLGLQVFRVNRLDLILGFSRRPFGFGEAGSGQHNGGQIEK